MQSHPHIARERTQHKKKPLRETRPHTDAATTFAGHISYAIAETIVARPLLPVKRFCPPAVACPHGRFSAYIPGGPPAKGMAFSTTLEAMDALTARLLFISLARGSPGEPHFFCQASAVYSPRAGKPRPFFPSRSAFRSAASGRDLPQKGKGKLTSKIARRAQQYPCFQPTLIVSPVLSWQSPRPQDYSDLTR